MTDSAKKPQLSELRNFGLVLGAMFALVLGLGPLLRGHHPWRWPFVVALVLWILAIAAPASLRVVYAVWTRIGSTLGWFNTRLILTAVYLIWVVPMGLVMKLLGRDPLRRRFEPALESYRVASRGRAPASMEKPY
jgi:MFS family permease